jgi:hypothetical protein
LHICFYGCGIEEGIDQSKKPLYLSKKGLFVIDINSTQGGTDSIEMDAIWFLKRWIARRKPQS